MDYDYSLPKRVKDKSRKIYHVFIFFIILIVSSLFLKRLFLPKKIQPAKSLTKTSSESKIKTKEELLSKIREIIESKTGSYSVFISDFSKNDSFGINENTIFTAASVNKIPILAALYYLAGKGEIDLDMDITIQAKDIQEGTGSIRYEPPGKVYSYKTLARLMMEKSDNTAAYILGDQIIGLDNIQELVNKWGLIQTDIRLNKTSNRDQEKLLRLIYEGKITTPELTSEMLDFMDDSDFEDRIPALLPKDVPIYHKVGEGIRNIHDVGIVNLPKKPYYLGVFVSDNPDKQDASETIAEISKFVYEYFENREKN